MKNALCQVVCPVCGVANRIAPGRVPNAAKCGQCKKQLFGGSPLEVNDETLARHLRLTQGAVLLDIWAPWCGPCISMAPNFAAAASQYAGKAVFLKMNADQCTTPNDLGVRSIPTLFLFYDGRRIAQNSGLLTSEGIGQFLEASIISAEAK